MKKLFSKLNAFKAFATGAMLLPALAFADDDDPTDLASALPDSLIDSGFWKAVGLVILAVVAVKAVFIVLRLIKRV